MIDSALWIHAFRWKQLMAARNDASPRPGPRAYGVDALLMSRPAPGAVAAFHGAFRCKGIGVGEAATAMVVHAEQRAAVDRGSPASLARPRTLNRTHPNRVRARFAAVASLHSCCWSVRASRRGGGTFRDSVDKPRCAVAMYRAATR
jgi:hypothetical protein